MIRDASQLPPIRGFPAMTNWEDKLGQTQNLLEGFVFTSGLGIFWEFQNIGLAILTLQIGLLYPSLRSTIYWHVHEWSFNALLQTCNNSHTLRFGPDIHVPCKINCNNFSDSLTLHLNLNVFVQYLSLYMQTNNIIPIRLSCTLWLMLSTSVDPLWRPHLVCGPPFWPSPSWF